MVIMKPTKLYAKKEDQQNVGLQYIKQKNLLNLI